MWRQSHNEDWERKKTHLLRSYFSDISRLSPIEESDENRTSWDIPPPPKKPPCRRRESPLPDLVIERIPKRNRHDEPEEFYENLQATVQQYVNRLKGQPSFSYDSDTTDFSSTSVVNTADDLIPNVLESSRERFVVRECSNTDEHHNEISFLEEDISEEMSENRDECEWFDYVSNNNDEEICANIKENELEDEINESENDHNETNSGTTMKLHLDDEESLKETSELVALNSSITNNYRLYFPSNEVDNDTWKQQSKDDDNLNSNGRNGTIEVTQCITVSSETTESNLGFSSIEESNSHYELKEVQIQAEIHANNNSVPGTITEKMPICQEELKSSNCNLIRERTTVKRKSASKEENPGSVNEPSLKDFSNISENTTSGASIQQHEPDEMRATSNSTLDSIILTVKNDKKPKETVSEAANLSKSLEHVADMAFIGETESMTFTPEIQRLRFSTPSYDESISPAQNESNQRNTMAESVILPIYIPSPSKRRRLIQNHHDIGLQTSSCDESNSTLIWNETKSNFFVGTPVIYKLCKCSNHSCN